VDSEDQEQLQLLLALEGLPADTVASTARWLERHGACVTSLHITYDLNTAPLFQQLPLSSAPLVHLARLEVDGPDSLVALATALPQLVALTHLRASIGRVAVNGSAPGWSPGVFSARGEPVEVVPCLYPGLKSLRLDIDRGGNHCVEAPLAQLLPHHLEELHVNGSYGAIVHSTALTAFTSLCSFTLYAGDLVDPDLLLAMPGLEEVEVRQADIRGGPVMFFGDWLKQGLYSAPQHLTKLAGLRIVPEPVIPPSLVTALRGLRKLHATLCRPETAACVKQLSRLSRLRDLSLDMFCEVELALSALSSVQQLTCLHLTTYGEQVPPPRSTWAEVLPHLTQLRVLAVNRQLLLLEGGLPAEVTCLTQLQCLYVRVSAARWDPAAAGAEVAPHLQALSQCSSLRAVLCWAYVFDHEQAAQPLWEYVHEGGLHLSCWHKWRHAAMEGHVVCPRPCPHLSGVWELQLPEAADD
jgi:hypothetical protein